MKDSIEQFFCGVPDPRVKGRCSHMLQDILFIALCTLLSNGEDFADMEEFGNQREDWLKKFLELPQGIPTHDTFNRVLQAIDPDCLSKILEQDAQFLIDGVKDKIVSFDGKKMRGVSPHSRGNKGLYILSAWVGEHRLCLGQSKVEDKSNEITAIPNLIDSLDLTGSIVSIDAIGCQTEVAKKIVQAKADYLLAVKKNQGSLYDQVADEFTWKDVLQFSEDWEYDHGRYETRKCSIVSANEVLSPDLLDKWTGIKTVVKIEATRTINNVSSSQARFYISSQQQEAEFYNRAARGHWSIENQLHWHLDITFKEDANRSRSGNAPQNLNILRKIALHRVAGMTEKLSLQKRRFRASLNLNYLEKILAV